MRYPKSLIVLVLVAIIGAVACLKEDSCKPISSQEEDVRMQAFLNTDSIQNFVNIHGFTIDRHEKGFYYIIIDSGNTQYPNVSNTITVNYKGFYTDFATFDNPPNRATFQLGALVQGWQYGLPLVGKGGRIMLILPPSLGYGCKDGGTIPPNSVIVFDIWLHDFF